MPRRTPPPGTIPGTTVPLLRATESTHSAAGINALYDLITGLCHRRTSLTQEGVRFLIKWTQQRYPRPQREPYEFPPDAPDPRRRWRPAKHDLPIGDWEREPGRTQCPGDPDPLGEQLPF